MKSKVTIDVDYDNQPVIKIEYQQSDDVRDTLVKKFLESFGSVSRWSTLTYLVPGEGRNQNSLCVIRPVHPGAMKTEGEHMIEMDQYVPKVYKAEPDPITGSLINLCTTTGENKVE